MKYYTPYPILLDFLLVMRTEYEIDYDGSQGSFYSSENRPGFFTSINRFLFLRPPQLTTDRCSLLLRVVCFREQTITHEHKQRVMQ